MNSHFLFVVALDFLWSGVASLGFAVLFSVPRRALAPCFIAGGVGHALRVALVNAGLFVLEPATLVGAVGIGVTAIVFARAMRAPVMLFTTPAAIPLVPGALAFKAMLGVLRFVVATPTTAGAVLTDALLPAVRVALVLGGIAIGVGMPKLLLRASSASELDR